MSGIKPPFYDHLLQVFMSIWMSICGGILASRPCSYNHWNVYFDDKKVVTVRDLFLLHKDAMLLETGEAVRRLGSIRVQLVEDEP